ncbi:hypothetical protein [Plastoroseomonas arctica]|uniref:DUF3592 domain-containing protein n=1 Tax=Plastoroseomonas arctica TaxID=1509237 RepID=A0AAF1K1B4_9PROT|nr:hypothetical protein [Plastoroseomonas arctica]MBR0654759.1 hypothetical protein [Plastoroseomonas arctica]
MTNDAVAAASARRGLTLFGVWIFAIIGILCLVGAGINAAIMARFMAVSEIGVAEIASVERQSRKGGDVFLARVVVAPPGGERLTDTLTFNERPAIGDRVEVRYAANSFLHIMPVSVAESGSTQGLLWTGAGLLVVAALFHLRHRRRG